MKKKASTPSTKPAVKAKPKGPAAQRRSQRLPQASRELQPANVIPGEVMLGAGEIVAFEERERVEVLVANTGDRPIQVGSHCHFFEANRALRFDREQTFGFRLQVPAGTAVRFEPGEEKLVTLVAIGGHRVAQGINGLTNGRLDDPHVRERALSRASTEGFTSHGTQG